jgi:hypothetical protein
MLPEQPSSHPSQTDKSELILSGLIILKISCKTGKFPGKSFSKKFPISTSLQWLRKTCATVTGLNVDKIDLVVKGKVVEGKLYEKLIDMEFENCTEIEVVQKI